MTIQQLEYATTLAHYKSFNVAAKSLNISQPGLSLQIKKLEESLQVQLFDRANKKVSVTPKGELILERARLLLNESSQLKQLARQLDEDLSGELRIGIIPTLAPYLLPLFINDLNETHNALKIHVEEVLTEQVIEDIKSGKIDGGIIATPISSKIKMESIPLFYEEFKLFISPEHPLFEKDQIDIEEVPVQDIWLLKEGNCFRDQVDNICDLSRRSPEDGTFFYESNSIESLCRIVEFKGGVTFLPELTSIHFSGEQEDMVKELKGKPRVRELSLVYLPKHIRKEEMKALSAIIKKNLPKKMLSKQSSETIPTNINL